MTPQETHTPGEEARNEVRALAQLALLPLSPEEEERFARDFAAVVAYISELRQLELPEEEEADVAGVENVLREDEARVPDEKQSAALVRAAARHKDGYIVVKQVLSYE